VRLACADCDSFVLDGYPRTLQQAEALHRILKIWNVPICVAVDIEVPDEAIVERAVGRLVCPDCGAIYHLTSKPPRVGRSAMCVAVSCRCAATISPSTVRHRLSVYHRITYPVLEFYRGRVCCEPYRDWASRDEVGERLRAQIRGVC
jgi:adenylate kinase